MDPSCVEAVAGQSSQGSASRSSAPGGGGGVAHLLTSGPPVPSNLHECYLYIFIYECMYKYPAPPPRHGQLDRRVGHSPPPLCEFFCSTVCILFGVCYAP